MLIDCLIAVHANFYLFFLFLFRWTVSHQSFRILESPVSEILAFYHVCDENSEVKVLPKINVFAFSKSQSENV